jgi:endogenous inhibitor of DNA gyrase (YacG/DUF329 family)
MKIKSSTKTVKCEMCDISQEDDTKFRGTQSHTMIVVSVWVEQKKGRKYLDFCSVECLGKWASEEASRE